MKVQHSTVTRCEIKVLNFPLIIIYSKDRLLASIIISLRVKELRNYHLLSVQYAYLNAHLIIQSFDAASNQIFKRLISLVRLNRNCKRQSYKSVREIVSYGRSK